MLSIIYITFRAIAIISHIKWLVKNMFVCQQLSLREEAPGEADKWRQRRNNSFDQNRQLEEVTKER